VIISDNKHKSANLNMFDDTLPRESNLLCLLPSLLNAPKGEM